MIKIVWSINDINKYQTGNLLDGAVKIETPQSVGDLMKKAVPDEYAEWMTDDIVDYMFDLDSDYKITIKVTDKEKIAKKVEDILNTKEKNSADEMYQQWKSKVTIVMEEPWGKINFSEKIMEE